MIRLTGSEVIERIEQGLLTTQVDGELIGMSVEQGTCYGFDAVGTRIWELLAEPQSIDRLCTRLRDEFDVGEAECRSDVIAWLEELHGEALVRIASRD